MLITKSCTVEFAVGSEIRQREKRTKKENDRHLLAPNLIHLPEIS